MITSHSHPVKRKKYFSRASLIFSFSPMILTAWIPCRLSVTLQTYFHSLLLIRFAFDNTGAPPIPAQNCIIISFDNKKCFALHSFLYRIGFIAFFLHAHKAHPKERKNNHLTFCNKINDSHYQTA